MYLRTGAVLAYLLSIYYAFGFNAESLLPSGLETVHRKPREGGQRSIQCEPRVSKAFIRSSDIDTISESVDDVEILASSPHHVSLRGIGPDQHSPQPHVQH